MEGGLDLEALGLVPLAVGTWGPFVFVNPDARATPLEETLGELPELVAAAGVDVDELVFHSRATSNVAANWKVCCENYLECYHCRVAHPGLVEVIDVAPESYGLDESRWFSTQIGPVRPDARGAFDLHGEIARGQFHFLFPNLTINIAPGRPNLSLGPVLPEGTQDQPLPRLLLRAGRRRGVDRGVRRVGRPGGRRGHLARGARPARLGSGLLEGGVLLPESERLIAHFDRLVADALR